eukprot:6828143-Alexandrium_andersonii.AAC.1
MASLPSEPLSADAESTAMRSIDVGPAFLFDQNSIPRDTQARIVNFGYSDTSVFAEMGDTPDNVRKLVASDVGINSATGPQH